MLRVVLAVATAAILSNGPAAAAPSKKDRLVCRNIEESGSRTRAQRICKTQAEWERAENEAKHEAWKLERSRVTPSAEREPR